MKIRFVIRHSCLLVFFLLVCLDVSAHVADFQTGEDAYRKGNYATALKELRPLAEQGDADVQFYLGVLYEKGKGVPQDKSQAAQWYRLAAEQGNATSQNNLGVLYVKGEDVRQDVVSAHMWFNLAAGNGYEGAAEFKDEIERDMTVTQIKKARKRAKRCLKQNYKGC